MKIAAIWIISAIAFIHVVQAADGCSDGFYGPKCSLKCGQHCSASKCETDADRGTYKCSVGCLDGWTGFTCERKCPKGCKSCDQITGTCPACKTGCCGKNCGPICKKSSDIDEAGRLELRTIFALLLVIPPFLIVGVVQVINICWERYKRRREMKRAPESYELCPDKTSKEIV